ncbi:MAG: DEAD/DEAH box helicase family protein [Verrucomicrobiales bacterium]
MHGYYGSLLVELALNLKSPVVTDPEQRISESSGKPYIVQVKNPTKTLEAQDKQNQLKRAFRDWVPSVPEVAAEIETIYNRVMNGTVAPTYEAPTWEHYPGASIDVTLRDHQKRVVTRMLQNSTLLAHAVGTGKTYAMITAAMEMRRLGLAHKPMIVVQQATLEQFGRAFKRLYPTARILVPSATQRERKHRNGTMSRIATGDWDCVIIPQSYVNMLPDDPKREEAWIRNEMASLERAKIEAQHAGGKKSPRAKDLENAKKRLAEKLKELANRKKDDVITFEQLGVDGLFVDEAHAYKKLQFTTQMDSIKGLDTGMSERGLSMFMKVRWVQEKNQGRNVIFATGTPVSNTIAEAWTMMRYLRPDVLKQYSMESFDSFAGSFGDTVTQPEMTAGGTWKQVTRFARYVNGPELLAAWRTVADVVTAEEINLPGLPALKNGRTTAVVVKQTPEVRAYVARLRARLEQFDNMKGREKRDNSHIPMVVFGLAKKASLDMRMVEREAEDHPDSKVNRAVQRILETYHESTEVLGTQMVFADLYQDDPDDPHFNLYQEIKRKLVGAGIPEKEVVILTSDIKDAKREALFAQFNEGTVRVAIGSTERMGVGVNAQRKLIALHHLDAPARPMDVEQRNGRIIRQGNENPVVELFSYGVENTLDAAMFQKLATKQRFINQILRGDFEGRDFEDAANEVSLSFEEQMAAFSGDPLAVEKVGVDNQVRELEALRAGHSTQLGRARDELMNLRERAIPATERAIVEAQRLARRFTAAFPGDTFRLELDGRTVTERKAVTEVFDLWVAKFMGDFSDKLLASDLVGWQHSGKRAFRLNGFFAVADFTAMKHAGKDGAPATLSGVQVNWQFSEVGRAHAATTGGGILQGIPSDLRSVSERPAELQGDLARMRRNETELAGFIIQPFERAAELEAALKRQGEIILEIDNRTKGNKFSYAEWLLDVPRDANKPLEAKRLQAQRILREMETNYAAAVETFNWSARNKKALADMGITPPRMPYWYQARYDLVSKSLTAIEAQLLQEAKGAPRVYHMMIFPPVPPDPDKQEVRQFMHQVADEPLVSDLAKGQIGNALYSRRGNRDDATMAVGLITAAGGPEQAILTWRDPANGVPQMVRAHLGMAIIKQLGVLQARAHAGGQAAEATRLAAVQASFVDEFSERSTDVAQYLQALRMFSSMTPEGFVQTYKRSVAKATREVRDELEPAIQAATQELNAAAQGALPELAGDAEIQAATTKAINESLAQDPVIQNAIRVVVSRSFGSSAVVMANVKATIQRAFQQIARGRSSMPLWEQYRRAAAAQLARLPKPAREKASLDAFTRRVMQALRGQIDAQFPPEGPDRAPRLAPIQQILEAFANPEKYSDVWATTLRELRARYPDDPRVEHLATLPAALVSPQTMRSLLEEELTRADIGLGELIARGYGVKDGQILKERIRYALAQAGVHVADQDVSGLASVADQEWRKMVEKEQGRTGARLQEARVRESRALRAARSGLVDVEDMPESEIDAAIRARLRETRSQLSSTIRGHWRNQVKEGQDLARAMTVNVGLDPVVAQQLAHRIETRFAKLLADRKAKAIERAIDAAPRVHRRREIWDRLVEASNMGLLSDEDAWRAVAPALKLPVYTREAASRVMSAAARIQQAPEGFQRDRAVVDLLDTIKREVGVPVSSLLLSLWYARLLSGPTTHILNILSNVQQTAMAFTTLAARRPGDVPALAGAFWDGMVKALPEMAEVLTTGRVTGIRMLKAEPAGAIELAPDKGLWKLMKHWRLVARLMAAEDLAVFMPLREARQMALAREQARLGGFKGDAFAAEVNRLLGAGPAVLAEAEAQAATEGLSDMDRRRRVNELIDARRPEGMREDAIEYALRQTFNGKPYGFLGVVSEHLRPILAKYPAGRIIVPFVNVVANVTNEAINYAPGANAVRLLEAYRKGNVYGRPGAYNDVFEMYAKAGAGLVLTSILGALVAAGWDKDEPEREFDISGPGPGGTSGQQLLATGWRPWSVRVGGAWYPYTETPLAIAFGSLGTYLDAVRYGKLKDRGTLAHVAYAARGMAAVAMNRSMLQGVADLVTALRKQGAERDDAVMRTLARPLGTVLSSRMVAQVDRMMDPTARHPATPGAALLAQIPYARRLGKPALNVWGQPIESSPWERFVSPIREDRLGRLLADRGAWIPMQTEAELGGKRGAFNADERYQFIQERGPALREHLERLLPRLESLTPEQTREMVSRVAEIHTARTKAQIIGKR